LLNHHNLLLMKHLFLLTLFFSIIASLSAQPDPAREIMLEAVEARVRSAFLEPACQNPIKVTPHNYKNVHHPYELTFLSQTPQNTVDSCIAMMMYQQVDDFRALIKKMAETRSPEAKKMLYLSALMTRGSNIESAHLHAICNYIYIADGLKMLNEYYFDNKFDSNEAPWTLRDKLINQCIRDNVEVFYCPKPTVAQLYEQEMADVPIKKIDRDIISLIKKHSNTKNKSYDKNLTADILKLPYITDVMFGDCYEHNCIYPGYTSVVVKIRSGSVIAERFYSMNTSKFHGFGLYLGPHFYFRRTIWTDDNRLAFKKAGYSPGYMKAARAYCDKSALVR
jgi:hypothetical protein